jgi:hypothetical protein
VEEAMSILSYLGQLVGNKGTWAKVGIGAFVAVLCVMFARCAHADEFHTYVRAGTSFGTEGYGPVLGLQFTWEKPTYDFFAGTDLWGATRYDNATVANNWDWHAGIESCKWAVCAGIGMDYVQDIDAINGAHTNFFLQLRWKPDTEHFRFSGVDVAHISDAGTSPVNIGRQAVLASFRLQ